MNHQTKLLAFKKSVFVATSGRKIDKNHNFQSDIIQPNIYQSWQRSFEQGLDIDSFVDDSFLQNDQLNDIIENNRTIISLATPELNKIYQLIKGAENLILLTDKNGIILDELGDTNFVDQAARILLTKGAKWSEADKGTNAIGTAIKEDRAITIHGGEHYLNANSFLTCSSVPIHDPYGDICGVLDISADYRSNNPHTLALIKISVEHIENEMFNNHFHQDIIVELYCNNSNVNWFKKNIMVFDFSGKLIAANQYAMQQFNLHKQSFNHKQFEQIFDQKINGLIDHILLSNSQPYALNQHCGLPFYAKAKSSYARLRGFANQTKEVPKIASKNALSDETIMFTDINLGDVKMANNIKKIKKIIPYDIPILLQGETGTGKGWLAKAIYCESQKANMPFVAINCASLPPALIESELFGYASGAFTGAKTQGYKGKLLAANGGYLFLDEIGDMPLEMQTRFLRVLEDKKVTPIGSNQTISFEANIISASNIDLMQAVENGNFRRDLYYRLNGLSVKLPKLSQRSDFEQLVKNILYREAPNSNINLSDAVWALFKQYAWPGNIRQLYHILRVSALTCDNNMIEIDDLTDEFVQNCHQPQLKIEPLLNLEDSEKIVIGNMLKACHQNLSKTAKKLNISRNTLYSKMRQYGL